MDLSNITFRRASLKPKSTEAKNNYLTKKPLKVTHKSAARIYSTALLHYAFSIMNF